MPQAETSNESVVSAQETDLDKLKVKSPVIKEVPMKEISLKDSSMLKDKEPLESASSANLRAFQSTFTSEELRSVKSYLHKRAIRDEQRGMFRLSKAMKWYLTYVMILSAFLYVYYVYPDLITQLLTLNTWLVVLILAMNYGLTAASFILTSWPASKSGPHQADGDTVLSWFGRALVILNFALFIVDLFSGDSMSTSHSLFAFESKAALNIPCILTAWIGFPRRASVKKGMQGSGGRVFLQYLGFFLRIIAQVGSSMALLLWIQVFGGFNTWIISAIVPIVPFCVFLFFYVRARVFGKILPSSKKHLFILFGERPIREPMMFVAVVNVVIWVIDFILLETYFSFIPRPEVDNTGFSIVTYLWTCSLVALVVFGIPATYHCMLDITEKKGLPTKYKLGKKRTLRNILAFCNICYQNDDDDAPQTYVKSPQLGMPGQNDDDAAIQEVHVNMVVPEHKLPKKDAVRPDFMNDVSLVIACHLSENNIKPTLNAALSARFPHANIFVAHNGGSLAPPDNTGNIVRNTPAYDGVQYVYLPEGNKTIAVNWVIENMVNTPLVMIIDDDVMLPSNVDIEGAYHELEYKEEMKAVAFTIRGVDTPNLWQVFQHIEYVQAGFNKIFQAQFGSVLTCHGAIALWRTDTVRDIFQEHNTEFNGEDLQMGLLLRRMNKNFTIGVNAVEPVPTTAPKSLLYEPTQNEKSLFVQRIFSWDMAAHHFIGDFLEIMLVNWERSSLILKPFLMLELWTQLQDWLRFIFIITMLQTDFTHGVFIIVLLVVVQLCMVVVFDRIVLSNRPDIQSSIWILFLYPAYNIIIVLFRFGGLLINIFYYTPWNPPRIIIADREDRGELPPKILGEYDVPKGLRDFYWKTVWKNPSEAYKRVARKVAVHEIPRPAVQAKRQQLKHKHVKELNLSGSMDIAKSPLISKQRSAQPTPNLKARQESSFGKHQPQAAIEAPSQLLPIAQLHSNQLAQLSKQLAELQQMQLERVQESKQQPSQYAAAPPHYGSYPSGPSNNYGPSYGGSGYGGPSDYSQAPPGYGQQQQQQQQGGHTYGGPSDYSQAPHGYGANNWGAAPSGYGGPGPSSYDQPPSDSYAQAARQSFRTSRPRSSSFSHYRYKADAPPTMGMIGAGGAGGWRRGNVAERRR